MSDEEDQQQQQVEEKPFAVERAKTGRAKCKRCKCPIEKGEIRIARYVASFFSDGKLMPAWHHVTCLFDAFAKQRASTKRIDDPAEDVKGWDQLSDDDKQIVLDKLEAFEKSLPDKALKKAATPRKATSSSSDSSKKPGKKTPDQKKTVANDSEQNKEKENKNKEEKSKVPSKDDSFREFRRVCSNVADVDAYTDKTTIVKRMFTKGSQGDGFKGDIMLWCKLLLPGAVKRIYNLQSKQLIKLFARLLLEDEDAMLEHLEQGDVAETISAFFENSTALSPCAASVLTIQDVDLFLENLSRLTKEDEQIQHFRSILDKCTANDLKMIVRLIKHDLRINCGPKHILEAIHSDAYTAFQMSQNLEAVLRRFLPNLEGKPCASSSPLSQNKVALSLMTPILPMLAEACTSVEMAMRKCPNGMLSEVKYDGERVQVHKSGNEFRYFSRSLKPVLPHKINLFKDYIGRAFPDGDDLILDSEVLLIDNETGQPLPFGSLGIHKKEEFKNANVCLYVFDCLYYNGEVLINKSMLERRNILKDRMTEIPNRIMLSEVYEVHDPRDLAARIVHVLKLGLEGLVLKDIDSKYEPGKRHWLKVKKDYLCGGAMADSADLVVLGAWYGTGNKGGMLSVFLMGCYDEKRDKWLTVTKVHTGHDDATLAALQDQLDMVKIGKNVEKLPGWLLAKKPMVPDFVARDPKKQPVWEITGAEFTNQGVHTAEGISIRFPRVTRIRDDKDWSTATSLDELRVLFEKKPESVNFDRLLGTLADVKDIPRRKLPDPVNKSPRKTKVAKTSSWDEPSTSFQVKEEPIDLKEEVKRSPEKVLKKRKQDESDEELSDKSPQSEKKRWKVKREVKEETKDSSKFETKERSDSGMEWQEEDRRVDRLAGRTEESFESLSDMNASDSDVEDTLQFNKVLQDVRASLAPGFDSGRRKDVRRLLKTLGATVVTPVNGYSSTTATHVIHPRTEIPSSAVLGDYAGYPRTARHVNVSWLEETAARSRRQDEISHAVQLAGDYCDCPCTHR
ncbi:DNA ligase 3 [Monomorium pharaonis]|uniref:DNA ligase 3 n=1 Tax=Monomorium pharaonis TaxID=307658 RepID=UPI0017478915|nr:DNA ligase 3 [Monomorium pharaonis]XP_036142770.1 DNA ligase 3 [Monomorium pharaonis]XP_036142771.1 DNA ligase 3 [Monomorium pharaonis]XP_036142772.1 DNA ligase 3 [Monomorium pharaonis]XP_036142773.1 DNA ligase 3 [Monomorium pharaonis]